MPGISSVVWAKAKFIEDSELGHSASGAEHGKWSPALHRFLDPLASLDRAARHASWSTGTWVSRSYPGAGSI
jgi:hypothetical protein